MRNFLAVVACSAGMLLAQETWTWNLPRGFPNPRVPADNPMTPAKVELGRHLFYDPRMSVNGKASCASCHKQELAFTDGRPVGIGATGEKHSRSAMSLVNIAYSGALTWNNPRMTQLEDQALTPMYGEHPIELGLREGDRFLRTLQSDPVYRNLFTQAFPAEPDPFTKANVVKAIASFERGIISAASPWDRYHYQRDDTAISDSAKRGEILFFSQPQSCFRCHGGFNFSGDTVTERNPDREIEFHNTFKAPTLRNIAVTAPYMHDGSIPTLDAALDHNAAGGASKLTPQDRLDLIEFLKSLTDESVLHDKRFAAPKWRVSIKSLPLRTAPGPNGE